MTEKIKPTEGLAIVEEMKLLMQEFHMNSVDIAARLPASPTTVRNWLNGDEPTGMYARALKRVLAGIRKEGEAQRTKINTLTRINALFSRLWPIIDHMERAGLIEASNTKTHTRAQYLKALERCAELHGIDLDKEPATPDEPKTEAA